MADTARTTAATFEWLRHVRFGCRVIEGDFVTSTNRCARVERITFDARDRIARVVQETPRMPHTHLGVGQITVGFNVTTDIDLNRVARWMTLHAPADGEDALSAREIARGAQRSAVRRVVHENGEG